MQIADYHCFKTVGWRTCTLKPIGSNSFRLREARVDRREWRVADNSTVCLFLLPASCTRLSRMLMISPAPMQYWLECLPAVTGEIYCTKQRSAQLFPTQVPVAEMCMQETHMTSVPCWLLPGSHARFCFLQSKTFAGPMHCSRQPALVSFWGERCRSGIGHGAKRAPTLCS